MLSCNTNDGNLIDCIDELEKYEFIPPNSNFNLIIPTIVLNDDDYGLFAFAIEENFDSIGITLVKDIIPEKIDFKLYGQNGNCIYSNEIVQTTFDSDHAIYLWDGNINSVPYNGILTFELLVKINQDFTFEGVGKIQSVSCVNLRSCFPFNGDCNVKDCRYYGSNIRRENHSEGPCF